MKKIALRVATAVLLFTAAGTLANGQSGKTIGDVLTTVSSKSFTTTLVTPYEKGKSLVLDNSCGKQAWSYDSVDFVIGGKTVTHPVVGIVDCHDPNFASTVLASKTVISVDIKAGEVLHLGGYLIDANRAIKAGETLPTLLLFSNGKYSIISIEEAPKGENKGDAAKSQPLLTFFDEHMDLSERTFAVEAWRLANKWASRPSIPSFIR